MRTAVTSLFLLLITSPFLSAQNYALVQAFPNLLVVDPVDLQHPGDGSNRLFVVEQPGVIKVFDNHPGVSEYSIFLDLRDRVITGGEAGLLGLAFHPDFKNNGYFYVNYIARNPLRTVISRFHVQPDNPLAADSTSEKIILTFGQPQNIHNGGQLAFGPDGYLYIASGDGGGAGDPQNNAQNRSNLLGKILRIDVDVSNPEQAYAIPADNPFYGSTEFRPEIYAYGLRNPWRFSFDFPTSRLWCGDVGQGNWEEVNIINRGGNYGWSIMEGLDCYRPSINCDTTGLTPPLWHYSHNNDEGHSITGGYVYRGAALPALAGRYIYGDFISGRIWALDYDSTALSMNTLLVDTNINISSFGIDASNELYVVAYSGAIYRLADVTDAGAAGEHSEFTLRGNQPNPVRSETVITYALGHGGHVTLTLHDIMGEEIRHLVDGWQAAGEHTVKLDVAGIPAGMYYYRLESGGKSAMGRMVVER